MVGQDEPDGETGLSTADRPGCTERLKGATERTKDKYRLIRPSGTGFGKGQANVNS